MRWVVALALLAVACDRAPQRGEGGGGDQCVRCHEGIERAHGPIPEDECTICHGGDGATADQARAHVPIPENWAEVRGEGLPPAPEGFIEDFASDQLDAIDPAYVRFINPGDIRVMWSSCGRCHPSQARSMPNSVMTTNAGHYYPTLLLAGIQDEPLALYGSYEATDPDCDPSILGTVCEVQRLVPPGREAILDVIATGDAGAIEALAYDHYLAKNCNTCHQAGYPRNDSPGLYRSTGCTGCHMIYGELGSYEGGDPTIPRGVPVHPLRHEITRAVTTQQCATCHFQGGRIGLLYQGIREGGFGAAWTPEFAEPIDRTLYGHAAGYYFTDEDTRNDVDETPPDVHFELGMHCADCHVGAEVHGDGRLYSTSKHQVDLRCEDCHGDATTPAAPGPDGFFRTARGRRLPQLSVNDDGDVVLTGIVDGAEHRVPQPAHLLAPGGDATDAMRAAMGPQANGFEHVGNLTCDTCHTSYNQTCVGCHVSYDLRLSQVDYQTGQVTPGLTRGSRRAYTLDAVLLGQAPDGRVQTVVPSQQVQMAVVGSDDFGTDDGEVLVGARDGERTVGRFREAFGSTANNGFAPFFQHTTSRVARDCATCHRRDDSPEELARVRGVYGFGTGEFLLEAHDGRMVDGLRFLADDGTPTTTWVHPGTGPVAEDRRDRALGVQLDALP